MKSIFRRYFIIALLLFIPAIGSTTQTNFYVVAHPDDWVLFMGNNAFRDAQNQNQHFVLIVLTAGDGGYHMSPAPGGTIPYYLGRENAAMRSIRFITNTSPTFSNGNGITTYTDYVYPAMHKISRIKYNNASVYFFRLPDGGDSTGIGYPANGYQTLKALYAGKSNGGIDRIESIDSTIYFDGWSDLINTLRELVRIEAGGANTIYVNSQDPAQSGSQCTLNQVSQTAPLCDDHMDHLMAGLAIQSAISNSPCIYNPLYLDYKAAWQPENLPKQEMINKTAIWTSTASSLMDDSLPNDWNDTYNQFLTRTYFTSTGGSPTCAL